MERSVLSHVKKNSGRKWVDVPLQISPAYSRHPDYTPISTSPEAKSTKTHPPFSQIPHGSSLRSPAFAVNDPCSFSKPQKKSVLLGELGRFTPTFPAQLRPESNETPDSDCVTWKSAHTTVLNKRNPEIEGLLTTLPVWAIVAFRFTGVVMRKAAISLRAHAFDHR
jgi:hypothetical protein